MTDESSAADHPDLVVFLEARSVFEARIVVAVLEDAGIPAYVPGGLLTDEFAMSQRLMNLQGVQVQVAADRLEDAREALAAAKASGERMLDDVDVAAAAGGEAEVEPPDRETPSPPAAGGGGLAAKIGLGLLAVLFAYLWLDTRAQLAHASTSPLYDAVITEDGTAFRWNHNGRLAFETTDRDGNGVSEVEALHNRDGVLVQRSHDADQNGMAERIENFDPSGRVTRIADDADQNGYFEVVREIRADGISVMFRDSDGDDFYDRIEVEQNGAVVVTQEFRGGRGYVGVQ